MNWFVMIWTLQLGLTVRKLWTVQGLFYYAPKCRRVGWGGVWVPSASRHALIPNDRWIRRHRCRRCRRQSRRHRRRWWRRRGAPVMTWIAQVALALAAAAAFQTRLTRKKDLPPEAHLLFSKESFISWQWKCIGGNNGGQRKRVRSSLAVAMALTKEPPPPPPPPHSREHDLWALVGGGGGCIRQPARAKAPPLTTARTCEAMAILPRM